MPVLHEKWVTSPLTVINDLFTQDQNGSSDRKCKSIRDFFESKLKSSDGLALIPSLNAVPMNMLHDGCLVRYRAMVQDQFSQELYLKVYHTVSDDNTKKACCGLYSDLVNQDSDQVDWDHPSNVLGDRQVLYCVPLPAETQWVKDTYDGDTCHSSGVEDSSFDRSALKRKLSEDGGDEAMEEEESEATLFQAKKLCSGEPYNPSSAQGHDLNFPLPDEKGLPCLVKVYSDCEFSVSSMVEVVGVLSMHPSLAPLTYEDTEDQREMDTIAERKVHRPPPSLVPRLHAITATLLTHSNPLLPLNLPSPISLSTVRELLPLDGSVGSCRAMMLDMLTWILSGDSLAAEYTLLHLLSSIYGRTEIMALGKLSLNLSHCVQGIPNDLYKFLTRYLTKCFLLPLSLDNMNTWRFTPKKDYEKDRLLSSVLQLSPGTEILVDETVLKPGQLSEVGVANLTTLGNLVQWQKLKYDFQFHSAEFDCDLPVLIASEGKSIIKVDCHVPLEPVSSCRAVSEPSPEQINQMRQYLSLCRGLDYTLTPQMQQMVEEDFMKMRQSEPEGMSAESFHHLLTVARLVCLSHASSTLQPELWQYACTLEKNRLQRLKNT